MPIANPASTRTPATASPPACSNSTHANPSRTSTTAPVRGISGAIPRNRGFATWASRAACVGALAAIIPHTNREGAVFSSNRHQRVPSEPSHACRSPNLLMLAATPRPEHQRISASPCSKWVPCSSVQRNSATPRACRTRSAPTRACSLAMMASTVGAAGTGAVEAPTSAVAAAPGTVASGTSIARGAHAIGTEIRNDTSSTGRRSNACHGCTLLTVRSA